MSRWTILLAGGGTAGHVTPALATAAALQRAEPDVDVAFVGTARGLEARLVPAAGYRLHTVDAAAVRGRSPLALARVPGVLRRATRDVTRVVRDERAVAAAVFGGYASVPLALAARRTRTPLVVHEQNAVPGLANRLAARWATAVAVSVPGAEARFRGRVALTGNPVREDLVRLDRAAVRDEACAALGLDAARHTLLAFGGSLGARRINDALVASAGRWKAPQRLQVLHATGAADHDRAAAAWGQAAGRLHVVCVPFLERMDLAYAAADVVLCRSGASSVAEIAVLGLPSVLVPYPHAAADEQTANARALESVGAAVRVADDDLDGAALVAAAQDLLLDDGRRAAAAAAARTVGRADAADRLAALLLSAARPPRGDP